MRSVVGLVLMAGACVPAYPSACAYGLDGGVKECIEYLRADPTQESDFAGAIESQCRRLGGQRRFECPPGAVPGACSSGSPAHGVAITRYYTDERAAMLKCTRSVPSGVWIPADGGM